MGFVSNVLAYERVFVNVLFCALGRILCLSCVFVCRVVRL